MSARSSPNPTASWSSTPSGFPKRDESCGVARQWCGRLGKVDNCQVGVFLAYAARPLCPAGPAALPAQDWADDAAGREKCHVPPEVKFQEKWQIAWTWTGACPGWPTAGSQAMTSWVGPRVPCGLRRVRSVMSWTCPATPWCVTSSAGDPGGACWGGRKRECCSACRRLGDEPTGIAVGADRGPRGREGSASGRRDDRASPDQAGRPDRPGGATGRDPSGWRVADRLCHDRRRPRGPVVEWSRWDGQRHRIEDVRGRQRRGGAGSLRGAQLGWMAPPYDLVLGSTVFLMSGTGAGRGENPRDDGGREMRQIFTRLLRQPRRSRRQIAEEITRVLLRNEESRIYHW